MLGEQVFNLRIQRNLTQQQAADLCGVSRTLIAGIENGKVGVSKPTLRRLQVAFNNQLVVPEGYLLRKGNRVGKRTPLLNKKRRRKTIDGAIYNLEIDELFDTLRGFGVLFKDYAADLREESNSSGGPLRNTQEKFLAQIESYSKVVEQLRFKFLETFEIDSGS